MRSHRRKNRLDDDGAESGSNEDTRLGIAGSYINPNCVAVSKWSGRDDVTLDVRASDISSFGEEGVITTKSSCDTLPLSLFIGSDEVSSSLDVSPSNESSSRRRKAETIVCLARSMSVFPGAGPTTSEGGNVLTRTFPPPIPTPTLGFIPELDVCFQGKKGNRSVRVLLLLAPSEYGGT